MHEAAGADDFSAEDVADALVSETDAEDGCVLAKSADDVVADSGFLRGAGAGGDDDALGVERGDLGEADFVVAFDEELGAEFAEILDEIVSERVVVI